MGHDIIEINGKKYNALSGELISGAPGHPKTKQSSNIDGVIITPAYDHPMQQKPTPRPPEAPKHSLTARHPAESHKRHLQKSHTLMRQGLVKPKLKGIESPAHQIGSDVSSNKEQVRGLNKTRMIRASAVEKSTLVSRFGTHAHKTTHGVVKRMAHLPVVAPIELAQEQQEDAPTAAADIFEQAVEKAVSHEAKNFKSPKQNSRRFGLKKKTFNRASAALATLLIVAFFTYQNVPNINYRIAASRAGINSSFPRSIPSGFAYKSIESSPGKLVINFRSNTDDRNFSVYQSSSNWSSEVLLNNFVTVNRTNYESYQELGKNIYIYDGSNATWVDGGVWYRIEGESKLTANQLLEIANSL